MSLFYSDYNWEVKGTVTMVTLCHAFTAIQCLENIEKRRNPPRLNYNAILAFSTISVKQRKFGTTRSIYAIKKDLERNSQNEYTRSTLDIAILTVSLTVKRYTRVISFVNDSEME